MKYLGLTLDSHWTFGDHFERLAPSVEATAIALGRLLPRPGAGGGGLASACASCTFLYGAPIWAIERKMDELGTAQIQLIEERPQNTYRKKETETVSKQTIRRMDTEAPNTPTTKGGQATVMEWQTVERRRKSKKASAEKQPAKTTPRSGAKNSRKAPERRTEIAGKREDKPPLLRTPRTSAVTIRMKEGSDQSYEEVLAATRDHPSGRGWHQDVEDAQSHDWRRRAGAFRRPEEGKDRHARSTTDADPGSKQGPRSGTLPSRRSKGGRDRHFGHRRRHKGHPGEGGWLQGGGRSTGRGPLRPKRSSIRGCEARLEQ